jgi:hypothetical protein
MCLYNKAPTVSEATVTMVIEVNTLYFIWIQQMADSSPFCVASCYMVIDVSLC